MPYDLTNIRTWRTWRVASAEDSSLPAHTTDENGNVETTSALGIGVHPYSALALRMFGTNTAGDTATMKIWGQMDIQRKFGSAPSQELWRGQVSLGSFQATTDSDGRPLNDGPWPAAVYFEVDSYDIGGATGGHNAAKAVSLAGGGQTMLILPTLGYTVLTMELTDMDGTGTEISTLGAIYRFISMGGVV